jgi:hypothetical protein
MGGALNVGCLRIGEAHMAKELVKLLIHLIVRVIIELVKAYLRGDLNI